MKLIENPKQYRIQKFYKQIIVDDHPAGCWEWATSLMGAGYGDFVSGGRGTPSRFRIGAHRFSYIIHKGKIPTGMQVCHHCDNKKCVNPDHLFLGSCSDNMQDCIAKGRWHTKENLSLWGSKRAKTAKRNKYKQFK